MAKNNVWDMKVLRKKFKQRIEKRHIKIDVGTAEMLINCIFNIIIEGLVETGEVKIKDFGTFYQDLQKERIIKNIGDEPIIAPAHGVVRFKPSQRLKDELYLWEDDI